ncbi:MAG TPA: hypothetical protein VGL05_22045 [Kribbella sp.]
MPNPTASGLITGERLARAVAAVTLGAIAVLHVLDLGDELEESKLVGYGFIALIAAALISAALLITVPNFRVWGLVDLLVAGAIAAYVLSRTTGLPTDPFDIGNWNCVLGIASLATETFVLAIATWRLQPHLPLRRTASEPSGAPVPDDADL